MSGDRKSNMMASVGEMKKKGIQSAVEAGHCKTIIAFTAHRGNGVGSDGTAKYMQDPVGENADRPGGFGRKAIVDDIQARLSEEKPEDEYLYKDSLMGRFNAAREENSSGVVVLTGNVKRDFDKTAVHVMAVQAPDNRRMTSHSSRWSLENSLRETYRNMFNVTYQEAIKAGANTEKPLLLRTVLMSTGVFSVKPEMSAKLFFEVLAGMPDKFFEMVKIQPVDMDKRVIEAFNEERDSVFSVDADNPLLFKPALEGMGSGSRADTNAKNDAVARADVHKAFVFETAATGGAGAAAASAGADTRTSER